MFEQWFFFKHVFIMIDINDNLKKLSFKKFDFGFHASVRYRFIQVVKTRCVKNWKCWK